MKSRRLHSKCPTSPPLRPFRSRGYLAKCFSNSNFERFTPSSVSATDLALLAGSSKKPFSYRRSRTSQLWLFQALNPNLSLNVVKYSSASARARSAMLNPEFRKSRNVGDVVREYDRTKRRGFALQSCFETALCALTAAAGIGRHRFCFAPKKVRKNSGNDVGLPTARGLSFSWLHAAEVTTAAEVVGHPRERTPSPSPVRRAQWRTPPV